MIIGQAQGRVSMEVISCVEFVSNFTWVCKKRIVIYLSSIVKFINQFLVSKVQTQTCRHHRRNGPARREKDRQRTIKHQARIQPDQDDIGKKNEAVSAEVILPFNGNANSGTAAAPGVTPPAAHGPPHPHAPSKTGQASANFATKKKVDVDHAKKKLFVAHQTPRYSK